MNGRGRRRSRQHERDAQERSGPSERRTTSSQETLVRSSLAARFAVDTVVENSRRELFDAAVQDPLTGATTSATSSSGSSRSSIGGAVRGHCDPIYDIDHQADNDRLATRWRPRARRSRGTSAVASARRTCTRAARGVRRADAQRPTPRRSPAGSRACAHGSTRHRGRSGSPSRSDHVASDPRFERRWSCSSAPTRCLYRAKESARRIVSTARPKPESDYQR